jgi:hypothetical protein
MLRRALLLAVFLVACADESADTTSIDAGPADAGSACDGGEAGPLGQCLPPKGPCDECATGAECGAGESCSDFGGCRLCSRSDGTRLCASRSCLSGDECCGGSFCVQPDDPEPCGGACLQPPDECGEGLPCPDGYLCESTDLRCACRGPVMLCRPVCPTTPCDDASRCEEGRCVPKRCPEIPCERFELCDETQRCVGRPCADHADCGQGAFCFDGRCRAKLGRCELPRP